MARGQKADVGTLAEHDRPQGAADGQEASDRGVGALLSHPGQGLRQLIQDRPREAVVALVREATMQAISRTGRGLDLSGADLTGLDLSGLDLRRATLTRARLDSAVFTGADLTGAVMVCPLMERTGMKDAVLKNVYSHALAAVSSDWSGVRMAGALDSTGALFHGVALVGADLSGGNYAGATFYQCDLSGADLRGCDLSGATFNECVMRATDLSATKASCMTITRSNADGLVLDGATGTGMVLQAMTGLRGLSLRSGRLPELRIRGAAIDGGVGSDAGLAGLQLIDVMLGECDFSGADLSEANWRATSGQGNVLRRTRLIGATWTRCRLPRTDLRGAAMENARLLECDLPESLFTSIDDDKGHALFTGRGLTARDCDLSRADFTDAYLYRASFSGDPVTGMRLDGAKFTGANLIQAYVAAGLPKADFRCAQGAYSRFNQSDLTGADLTGAGLYQASFVKVILSRAVLTSVRAPFFLDRCQGLDAAVMDDDLRDWSHTLTNALATRRSGST